MDCPKCQVRVCPCPNGWMCLSCRNREHFPDRNAQRQLALLAVEKGYLLEMQVKDTGFFHLYDQSDRRCIASFASAVQLITFLEDQVHSLHFTQPSNIRSCP